LEGPGPIPDWYLFQSSSPSPSVLTSRQLLSAAVLTASRVGAIPARGQRRQDVLGKRALYTWSTQTVGGVPPAQRLLWAKSFERWRPLARGVPAPRGPGVTRRWAVGAPPAPLYPRAGVGHRDKRLISFCSTIGHGDPRLHDSALCALTCCAQRSRRPLH